jgi:hypothetical protein
MSNDGITTLPRVDNHFGGCPACHKTDGFLSVGPGQWFVCHRHRVKWFVGSNLFSGWKEQDEQHRLANYYKLAGYRDVEPWFSDDAQERLEREFRANPHGDECPF